MEVQWNLKIAMKASHENENSLVDFILKLILTDDIKEEQFISNPISRKQKLPLVQYARLIKDYLKTNRLKDALMVLEETMIKKDRVKPDTYIYNLLISGCARAGYTRKAFNLFTRMRNRGLKITGGTYTSLFVACANAPSAVDGLGRANHLREIMLEKGYEPNIKNYNAMIKAYGRCGDIKTAFLLVDEMLERKIPIQTETFNFLLQACASDEEFGFRLAINIIVCVILYYFNYFRHCLLTWHKMLQQGIRPDYYTFSGVLRCVRDTGFGDLQSMQQLLNNILQKQNIAVAFNSKSAKLLSNDVENIENHVTTVDLPNEKSLQISNNANNDFGLPNLLSSDPHLGSMISLSEIQKPHERFLLLGGLTGFLETMKTNNITPDIEMFTLMLEVIPPTIAAEKQVLTFIRKIGLKADIDFFNILIKKRSMRFDYDGAKEVLSMVRTAGLQPDIVTYGVLALGCQSQEEANELLMEMRNNNIR